IRLAHSLSNGRLFIVEPIFPGGQFRRRRWRLQGPIVRRRKSAASVSPPTCPVIRRGLPPAGAAPVVWAPRVNPPRHDVLTRDPPPFAIQRKANSGAVGG